MGLCCWSSKTTPRRTSTLSASGRSDVDVWLPLQRNGPQPPTLHARTRAVLHSQSYPCARREWLGQPCRTPDHGLPPPLFGGNGVCGTRSGTEPPSPEGEAWAALECIFALHRPSITFHATPPRTTQHVPPPTFHTGTVLWQISTYEHVVRRATLAGYAVRLGSPGIPGYGRRSSPTLVLLYAGDYVGVELGNCSRK